MLDVPQTLPVDNHGGSALHGGRRAWLVVAFRSDRPLEPPTRHALDDIDKVSVERGAELAVVRHREGTTRCLTLSLPDGSISSRHFSIASAGDHRVVRDAGSRNGTLVNGIPRKVFPIGDGDVIEAGRTLLVYREVEAGNDEAEPPDCGPTIVDALVTISPDLAGRLSLLPRLATANVPVLVQSETGTGKELVSRALHVLSGRTGAFLAVNCGAIPATMVEAELFGHRKGAFSGATEDRPGLVRAAGGGTLLLDEVGDLPAACQAALLRVLQTKVVRPIGETKEIVVDVRFVAATHRDLRAMVAAGSFRGDLLARISGYVMTLPPLRTRKEDVGILAGQALARMGPPAQATTFTATAARALFRHEWPLNVRELHQCIEAAVVLAGGRPVDVAHLPAAVQLALEEPSLTDEPSDLTADERRHRDELLGLLRDHSGNISAVARATGKARMQVQRWMKRYGLAAR